MTLEDHDHQDHLKYTIDQLLTNMVLLEEHFKNFHCDECRNKHLLLIAGFADEGIPMTDQQELRDLLRRIKDLADRMKEDVSGWNDSYLEQLRDLRRQLQNIYMNFANKLNMDYQKILMYEGKPMYDSRVQQAVREIIEYESRKYGVPPPKIIFRENKEFCSGTSCTITDSHGRMSQMWLKPDYFSLRTVLHEFYHHMATVLGPEGVKKYFPDLKGDADSEDEANIFAEREAMNLQASGLNTSTDINKNMEQVSVLKQEGSDIFRHLSDIYGWAEGILKLPRSDLNLEYSPEFVGRILEDGYDYIFSPVGAALANLATSLVLMGIGTLGSVGPYDRQWLNEWAAHHLFAVLALATPENMAAMASTSKAMGALMAQGKAYEALRQLTRPNIFQTLRSVTDSIQSMLTSAFPSAPAPATPAVAPSMKAEQNLKPGIFTTRSNWI